MRDRPLRYSVIVTLIMCHLTLPCLTATIHVFVHVYYNKICIIFGSFHSEISPAYGTEISGKEENFKRYTQIILTGISVPLPNSSQNFRNFRLNGSHFENSTIIRLSGRFSRKLFIPFVTLSKHPEFLVEWKARPLKFRCSEFFKDKSE